MRDAFIFVLAALCCLTVMLVGCGTQQTQQPIYVTRTVTECSWAPTGTLSASDSVPTKRWMIAYEKARQTNCPNSK